MSTITNTIMTPGWDAGARSISNLYSDGGFTFKVGQSIGIVCGINYYDGGADYKEITHGFYIEDKHYKIVELGVIKYSGGTITDKDNAVFKIERINGEVKYYINDVLKYTSTTLSEGAVFLDCSMYYYLDTLIDPAIYTLDSINVSLLPLDLFATDTDGVIALIELSPLTVDAEQITRDSYAIYANLHKLTALAIDDSLGGNATALIELSPLTSSSSDSILIPEYNAASIFLKPLSVSRIGFKQDDVTVDLELSKLTALAVDGYYNLVYAELLPLSLTKIQIAAKNYLYARLPSFTALLDFITEVSISHDSSWNHFITSTHQSSWRTIEQFHSEHQSSWGLLQPSIEHQSSWGLVASIAHHSSWRQTEIISNAHEAAWEAFSVISSTHTAGWDVVPILALSVAHTASWDQTSTLFASHQSGWTGYSIISNEHQSGWTRYSIVSNEHQSGWDKYYIVNKEHQSGWGKYYVVNIEHKSGWDKYYIVNIEHQSSWDKYYIVNVEHKSSWEFNAPVTIEHDSSWRSINYLSIEHLSSWYELSLSVEHKSSWRQYIEGTVSTEINLIATVGGNRVFISSATVSCDEGSSYWSCEMQLVNANDKSLFQRNTPFYVNWFGTTFSFIVDNSPLTRSIDSEGNINNTVSINGLSPLCMYESPRATVVTKTWDTPLLSSVIVTELLGSVTWNLVDWVIPANRLSVDNASPLSVAKQIVEAAGGLIESNPDGSIVVRHKWPVAANLLSTDSATLLGDSNLFSVAESSANDNEINRLRILDADSTDRDTMEFVQDENDWKKGIIRAYPSPWRGNLSITKTRNSPPIYLTGESQTTESLTEIIEFTNGGGSTSKPISQLTTVVWMDVDLGGLSFQPYSTELTASIHGWSLAEVTYITRYMYTNARTEEATSAQFLLEEEI